MSWVKLDDGFHSNDKILAVGNDGAGLYARALSRCGAYLTDGFLSMSWSRTAAPKKLRDRLITVGLWVPVSRGELREVNATEKGRNYTVTMPDDGYFICDYLKLNPSKGEVQVEREKKAAAGRKGARNRWQNA